MSGCKKVEELSSEESYDDEGEKSENSISSGPSSPENLSSPVLQKSVSVGLTIRKRINYESVYSLSVSSSPGGNLRDHNANECKESESQGSIQFSPVAKKAKLSFGIDRILSEGSCGAIKSEAIRDIKEKAEFEDSPPSSPDPSVTPDSSPRDQISALNFPASHLNLGLRQLNHYHSHNSHGHHSPQSVLNLSRCTECYFLSRYGGNGVRGNLQYSPSSSGELSGGVSASFSPHPAWIASTIYENSPLLSPSAYHPQSTYGLNASTFSAMSSLVGCGGGGVSGGRRKRSWSRAVFSSLQRKGLEKRFQIQKYITKPDRRQLAATLGLTDAQVKVWFQNRRMKWRHSKEGKVTSGVGEGIVINAATSSTTTTTPPVGK